MTLQTQRLILVPATTQHLAAVVQANWPALSTQLGGVDFAERWAHFPEALAWMHDHLLEFPEETGWWLYFVVHRQDIRLVGTAGFKGFPDPEGYMEIGYEIADAYQGRGLATEAGAALLAEAFSREGVIGVRAHTLATENASCKVLRKLGFTFLQEKFDAEDGRVWEWLAPSSER